MTGCKHAINLSFTPLLPPLVTPNVTPWIAILTGLVRVVYVTFVLLETAIYYNLYAPWTSKTMKYPLKNGKKLSTIMTQHNQDAYLTQDFINIMPIWWCILITISIPLFWIFWRHRKPFFNVSRSCRSKKLISQQNFAFSPFLTLFFEKNQQEVDQMSPNFNPSKFLHLSHLRFSPKPRITFFRVF